MPANRQMTRGEPPGRPGPGRLGRAREKPAPTDFLQPHGGLPTPVFATPQRSAVPAKLVRWVLWVTGGQGSPGPDSEPIPPPMPPTGPGSQDRGVPGRKHSCRPSSGAVFPPLGPSLRFSLPIRCDRSGEGPATHPSHNRSTVLPGTSQAGTFARFPRLPQHLLPAGPNGREIPEENSAGPSFAWRTPGPPPRPRHLRRLPDGPQPTPVRKGSPQGPPHGSFPPHSGSTMTAAAHSPPNRVNWASSPPDPLSYCSPVVFRGARGSRTAERASRVAEPGSWPPASRPHTTRGTENSAPKPFPPRATPHHPRTRTQPGSPESSKSRSSFFPPWKLRLGELLRK